MTMRRNLANWRRELQAAIFGRLANRVFTRSTSGIDGLAKRLIASRLPPVEHDPELDHPECDPPRRAGNDPS